MPSSEGSRESLTTFVGQHPTSTLHWLRWNENKENIRANPIDLPILLPKPTQAGSRLRAGGSLNLEKHKCSQIIGNKLSNINSTSICATFHILTGIIYCKYDQYDFVQKNMGWENFDVSEVIFRDIKCSAVRFDPTIAFSTWQDKWEEQIAN